MTKMTLKQRLCRHHYWGTMTFKGEDGALRKEDSCVYFLHECVKCRYRTWDLVDMKEFDKGRSSNGQNKPL